MMSDMNAVANGHGHRTGGVNRDGQEMKANGKKRDTMLFLGAGPQPVLSGHAPRASSYHASPPSSWGRSYTSVIAVNHEPEEPSGRRPAGRGRRGSGVHSGEFTQEGGILGKLGFEDLRLRTAQSRENSWIEVSPLRDMVGRDRRMSRDEGTVHVPQPDNGTNLPEDEVPVRKSEEMEVLESAEKKQKFWKGPRLRRLSKASSDVDDEQVRMPIAKINEINY